MTRNSYLMLVLSLLLSAGVSAQVIHFEGMPGEGGKVGMSSCVRIDNQGTLATVVDLHSDPTKAVLHVGGEKMPLTYIANDLESRVAIYRLPDGSGDLVKDLTHPASSNDLKPAQAVYLTPTGQKAPSSVVGRVYRFQGKVLPLAVIRVNHPANTPLPGSGVYNEDGKLVALIRQKVHDKTNASYCLPSEVITRIISDHNRNRGVKRCWIGIIMDELVATPIVESVRPDSPAKKAGLQNGDVILSIGNRPVEEYAEVVDAFYYLIAGESKKFRILRGTKMMEFDVTPEVSPGR